jgi:PAS domain S-box-containing protein
MTLGLRSRFALILVLLTISIVALVGGSLLIQYQVTNDDMRHSSYAASRTALIYQTEKRAQSMATYLADNLVNPMYQLEIVAIKELAVSAASQSGVNYVYIFDESRRVLHDGTDSLKNYGRLLDDDVTSRAIQTAKPATQVNETSVDIVVPILLGTQSLGGVKVNLSLEHVQQDILDLQETLSAISADGERQYILTALIVCAVLVLTLPLLSIGIVNRQTRPIEILSELTRRIAGGHYDIEIPFDRSDEIGELAGALKVMAEDLRDTTVSKRYVDSILSSMRDILLVFDRDGKVLSTNTAACRSLKCSPTDLVGRPMADILVQDRDFNPALVSRDVGSPHPISMEGELRAADGTLLPVQISWSAIADTKENDRAILCVARDITERKAAEQALRESEERFRALVANLPSAIFLTDLQRGFVLVNPRFEEWYGVTQAELRGKPVTDLFPDSLAPLLEFDDRLLSKARRTKGHEFDETFADGTVHSIIGTTFPVSGTDGSHIGIGTVLTDVTEQRRAEAGLKQAQKMEAIGQLTGGVAHDFNNLLAVIMGNAELLEEHLGDDDTSVNAIIRASLRGAELTKRMLAFGRRQPLHPRAFQLDDLVIEMHGMLSRTLTAMIKVEILSAPGLWPPMADPGQVEGALLNVVINARHAMPNGGRLLIEMANVTFDADYAATQSKVKAGDYVMLAVSDTGHGMNATVLRQAFEPFFTTKGVGEGSGLGLSMVYGFAKQSGGHVTIYSEEGHGTTVKLYLPRAVSEEEADHPPEDKAIPRGLNELILVIEDDRDVRTLTIQMLEGLGYQATGVVDAAGARQVLAAETEIRLVLSDVLLPGGVTGPDFAAEVAATRQDLPFIFMSGYSEEAAKQNGLLSGEKIILLSKPFQTRQLAAALRRVLD